MRELLSDKYNRLKKRETEIENAHAEAICPGLKEFVGKKLYELRSSPRYPMSEPEEWTVTDVGVVAKNRYELAKFLGGYSFPSGRVTKKLIAEAEEYLDKLEKVPLDMYDALFGLERFSEWTDSNGERRTCKSSYGVRFVPGKGFDGSYSFDKESFREKIEHDKAEYEKFYAPREGYVPCERCGKQVPETEAVKYNLIYRAYDNRAGRQYVAKRMGKFCSGECAMNEQMALEG